MLRCCNLSSTDVPDRLVSNDHIIPVGNRVFAGIELTLQDIISLGGLSLSELLPNTEDYIHSLLKSILSLLGHKLTRFVVESSSLAMSEDDPLEAEVLNNLH